LIPGDYRSLLDELAANQGATDIVMRQKLAAKAFAHTAQYDAMVSLTSPARSAALRRRSRTI
jgi:AICAR transformylase/IMP cyclohydrolase PurH